VCANNLCDLIAEHEQLNCAIYGYRLVKLLVGLKDNSGTPLSKGNNQRSTQSSAHSALLRENALWIYKDERSDPVALAESQHL
jgi:hypothetical protein